PRLSPVTSNGLENVRAVLSPPRDSSVLLNPDLKSSSDRYVFRYVIRAVSGGLGQVGTFSADSLDDPHPTIARAMPAATRNSTILFTSDSPRPAFSLRALSYPGPRAFRAPRSSEA